GSPLSFTAQREGADDSSLGASGDGSSVAAVPISYPPRVGAVARGQPVRAHGVDGPRRVLAGRRLLDGAAARRLPVARERVRTLLLRRRSVRTVAASGWRATGSRQ